MNVRERLLQAEARLQSGPHPERARRDAETLLLHLTGKDRAWLIAHGNDEFGGCTAIGYAALIDRRYAGEPIQYITGECEFYGLQFRVTSAVLIPRPETEHLVEKAIQFASGFGAGVRILDVGTGSGAIAIALARALPTAHITAIDLSSQALEIALFNAQQNGVTERIRFLEGDLLAPVAGEHFDLIVSNPPYVPLVDRPTLAVEVREHEPTLALFSGDDGLGVYHRLIPASARALSSGGFLVLEIGCGQSEAIGDLLAASGFHEITFTPDLQGIPRVASAHLA